MIKKGLLTLLVLIFFTNIISAQKHNIVNASIALRNEEYVDAKKYIDEAYETESTSNDAKMWNYRSQIYLQIALKQADLDENAVFKATEAHLKCLQTDKKGRVIVRKWTPKEDVLAGTVQCGYKLFNKAIEEYNAGNYKSSLKHYDAIFEIIPLDTEDQLKSVLKSCYDAGGNPNMIMVGAFNKQKLSGFTGGSTRFDSAEDRRLITSIDVYESDFGTMQVSPNRFIRGANGTAAKIGQDAHILDMEYWAVSFLRDFALQTPAQTADADQRFMVAEYTLESRNEKASGLITDLTTS